MKKLKEKLRQGNGEIIMYAAVLVPLFILLIGCAGILQITGAYGELNKAVVTAGRAASICKEETDAQDQVQRVASSCITVPTIKNLSTSIEMVDGDWGAGSIAKVTVEGDVNTIAPFLLNGHYSRSTLVTIEGGGKNYGLWRLTAYCSCPICQGPWHVQRVRHAGGLRPRVRFAGGTGGQHGGLAVPVPPTAKGPICRIIPTGHSTYMFRSA